MDVCIFLLITGLLIWCLYTHFCPPRPQENGPGPLPHGHGPEVPNSLPNLLKQHNLPPGLFPSNVVSYEFNNKTRALAVTMPHSRCQMGDQYNGLQFVGSTVTGILDIGKLSKINEIRRFNGMSWAKATSIAVKRRRDKNILHFGGNVDQVCPFDHYMPQRQAFSI